MAGEPKLTELRMRTGTTLNTTFTAPNASGWDSTEVDVDYWRAMNVNDAAMVQETVPDETLKRNIFDNPAPIPTVKRGDLAYEIWGGQSNADVSVTIPPTCQKIADIIGGVDQPAAASYTADASGSTTTTINTVNAPGLADNEPTGAALLVGGEVVRISGQNAAGDITSLERALSAAPDSLPVYTGCHAYYDPSTAQKYFDFTWIGNSNARTYQANGCQATSLELQGTAPEEALKWAITMASAGWQLPTANLEAMTDDTLVGNDPVTGGSIKCYIGDAFSPAVTRALVCASNISITGLSAYTRNVGGSGLNGTCGWVKTLVEPTISFDLPWTDDMPGLQADVDGRQSKHLCLQWGNTPGSCFAITGSNGKITSLENKDVNGLDGVGVTMVFSTTLAIDTSNLNALKRTPLLFSWF